MYLSSEFLSLGSLLLSLELLGPLNFDHIPEYKVDAQLLHDFAPQCLLSILGPVEPPTPNKNT